VGGAARVALVGGGALWNGGIRAKLGA
jgi:hypothetical protein